MLSLAYEAGTANAFIWVNQAMAMNGWYILIRSFTKYFMGKLRKPKLIVELKEGRGEVHSR